MWSTFVREFFKGNLKFKLLIFRDKTTLNLLSSQNLDFFLLKTISGVGPQRGPQGHLRAPGASAGPLLLKTLLFTLGSRAPLGPYIGGRAPAGALYRKKSSAQILQNTFKSPIGNALGSRAPLGPYIGGRATAVALYRKKKFSSNFAKHL